MREKGLKLFNEILLIIMILFFYINFGNHLAISQENAESKGVDIKKFSKEYQTSKLKFKFTYLCDAVIDRMFEKKEAKAIKTDIGLDKTFFLEVTPVEPTKFDPTKLVFVQKGEQFEIETKSYFQAMTKIGRRIIYEKKEIYPGVFIKGFLFLPFSFDPTALTMIWYEKEKLGSFVVPSEYKDLLFSIRKPIKIYLYDSSSPAGEEKMQVKFELQDEYNISGRSDGIITCQLYSLKDEELLYEEKRKVSYKDFITDTGGDILGGLMEALEGRRSKVPDLVYRWYIDKSKIFLKKMMIKGEYYKDDKDILVAILKGGKSNVKLIVSFTLPTGEILRTEKKLRIIAWHERQKEPKEKEKSGKS